MPENTTVTVTSEYADEYTASFGEIRFTEPGEFTYTVTETNAGQVIDGIEYGGAKTIKVTVGRDTDGYLKINTISEGYVPATTTNSASGTVTITNTWVVTDADATKVWENADGTDTAPEGATVVFTLYADEVATEYYVTLNGKPDSQEVADGETWTAPTSGGYESEAWKALFVNLPKYKDVDGEIKEIEYTIEETTGYASYEKSPSTAVESGGTITNKQITTVIELTKIGDWTVGNTLSNVQFKLYSDAACTKQMTKDSAGATIGDAGLITTDSNGKAQIGTLAAGTYYLKETATVEGYILLNDAIEFTIGDDGDVDYSTGNSNFDVTPGATYETDDGIGIYINNPSGEELPMTGGIGTTIFYVLGSLLVVGCGIMLVARRRMKAEEK